MNEKKQQFIALGKILVAVVFAFLYSWGGMEHKWIRRFVAPTILTLSMFGFSRNWKVFIQLPFMFASLSIGYGGAELMQKIIRRGLYGLANGITSSGYNLIRKKWLLAGFQAILLISAYIVFGVFNPLPNARVEEMVLGFLIAFIPIMSV